MTASNVPSGLKYQLLSPFNPEICCELYSRIILAIHGIMDPGSAYDNAGVLEALNTSGLLISQNLLEEEQESQIWFSSKWALKIVNKMASKSGLKMDFKDNLTILKASSDIINNNENSSNFDNDNNKNNDINDNDKQKICLFKENPCLICVLCRFWSILLPHAVFSTSYNPEIDKINKKDVDGKNSNNNNNKNNNKNKNNMITFLNDNKSWKALSYLSFGTGTVERLWLFLDDIYYNEKNRIMCKKLAKIESNKNDNINEKKNEKISDKNINKIDDKSKDKNNKKNGSTIGNFFNLFGFNNNKDNDNDNTNDNDNKKNESKEISYLNNNQKVNIEDFGNKIFSPYYHLNPECSDMKFSVLITFATILKTILTTTDDYEFYTKQKPFKLVQYVRIIRTFKCILYRMLQYDPTLADESSASTLTKTEKLYSYGCVRSISGVLSDLYLRWARRPFSPSTVWVLEDVLTANIREEIRTCTPFAAAILREMPWCLNFYERMKIFRESVDAEKFSIQGNDPHNPRRTGVVVNIRRSHVLLDGVQAFEKVGSGIKDKIIVKYIDAFGQQESGKMIFLLT